jgi:catalase
MRVDGNGGRLPNYFPNSFDSIQVDASYSEPSEQLESTIADWYDRNSKIGGNDHYSQPRALFREVMTKEEQDNTISNVIGAMSGISGPKRDLIVNRQLCHWFRMDEDFGRRVAAGLGVNVDAVMESMNATR